MNRNRLDTGGDATNPRDLTPEQEERLADYLAGTLDGEARKTLELELLEDDRLAGAMYSEINVASAVRAAGGEEAVTEIADADELAPAVDTSSDSDGRPRAVVVEIPWWRRWQLQIALPVAAAAMLAMVILPRLGTVPGDPSSTVYRGDSTRVETVLPSGAVEGWPRTFVWTASDAAASYRFELYSAELELVYQAVTSETTLTLPDDEPSRGRAGFWRVVPLTAGGLELEPTAFVAFELIAP